jgi:hypothetical protein
VEYFEGNKAHSVAGLSKNIIKEIVPKLSEKTTYLLGWSAGFLGHMSR